MYLGRCATLMQVPMRRAKRCTFVEGRRQGPNDPTTVLKSVHTRLQVSSLYATSPVTCYLYLFPRLFTSPQSVRTCQTVLIHISRYQTPTAHPSCPATRHLFTAIDVRTLGSWYPTQIFCLIRL